MREQIDRVVRELTKRAGLSGVAPGVVAACACLALAAVLWACWRWWPREPQMAERSSGGVVAVEPADARASEAPVPAGVADGSAEPSVAGQPAVVVHVAGKVRNPGVYELAPGSRAADAIDAAGGAVGDASLDALNLARVLADGEQLYVPGAGETASPAAQASAGPSGPGAVGAAGTGGPVNINAADATQLDTLPGVGPSTAAKIIAEREANGPFSSVDDLSRVSGIGPKRIEQLRDLVCVR